MGEELSTETGRRPGEVRDEGQEMGVQSYE